MTVDTGGPVRGFIGRWLMRFEVSQSIMSMFFQGTTAVSALSGVLSYAGYNQYVLPVLAIWGLMMPAIAFIIADGGILNRKNREKSDYGNNYSTPRDKIDDTLIGTAVFAAIHGREPTEDELDTIENSVDVKWRDFRNGVDVE